MRMRYIKKEDDDDEKYERNIVEIQNALTKTAKVVTQPLEVVYEDEPPVTTTRTRVKSESFDISDSAKQGENYPETITYENFDYSTTSNQSNIILNIPTLNIGGVNLNQINHESPLSITRAGNQTSRTHHQLFPIGEVENEEDEEDEEEDNNSSSNQQTTSSKFSGAGLTIYDKDFINDH